MTEADSEIIKPEDDASYEWSDAAVSTVAALEKATHDTPSADFQKYNQKMHQLVLNVEVAITVWQRNAVLARRLLNKEFEPDQIVGHSRGGSTAALLTYILRERREPGATCVIFAPVDPSAQEVVNEVRRQFIQRPGIMISIPNFTGYMAYI